jgi:tetratricopeptide (TPR) repeat protein
MKAEHRKELQTNTLAASMSRLAQRIKTRPQRRTVLWVLLVLVIVVGLGGWWMIHRNRQRRLAVQWYETLNLDPRVLQDLISVKGKPALSARFQYAWLYLWEGGIKELPNSPEALKNIRNAQERYAQLADECKDAPDLAAEAYYNMAVAQEALAVAKFGGSEKALQEAAKLYKEVVDNYPETARARDARERLNLLESEEGRRRVAELYLFMGIRTLGRFPGGKLPPGFSSGP